MLFVVAIAVDAVVCLIADARVPSLVRIQRAKSTVSTSSITTAGLVCSS
jgi:hypothetical protein